MFAMTAAHRNLPLPTYVRVTHLGNGRSIVVRINDRGPFHPDRVIDLSYAAAAKLDILDTGSGPVEIRAIRTGADVPDRTPPDRAPIPIRLYVQIGAYLDEANARRALARAARVRPGRASITRFGKEGRVFHRVRIGPLSGPEEADRVIAGLDSAGMGAPGWSSRVETRGRQRTTMRKPVGDARSIRRAVRPRARRAAAAVLVFAVSAVAAATAADPVQLNAKAWILQDFHTGTVLSEQEADRRVEPASLVKLMTAYTAFAELAAGELGLEERVTISRKAWRMGGSQMFIEVGSQVSVEQLLKGSSYSPGTTRASRSRSTWGGRRRPSSS